MLTRKERESAFRLILSNESIMDDILFEPFYWFKSPVVSGKYCSFYERYFLDASVVLSDDAFNEFLNQIAFFATCPNDMWP
jgi:hypothetical protein